MQVIFFGSDGFVQPLLDRRQVQFKPAPENPAPPLEVFIWEHFKQAVLVNVRGAGQIRKLDYDKTCDAQSMTIFESGDWKPWFEKRLAEKLVPGGVDMEAERYTKSAIMG